MGTLYGNITKVIIKAKFIFRVYTWVNFRRSLVSCPLRALTNFQRFTCYRFSFVHLFNQFSPLSVRSTLVTSVSEVEQMNDALVKWLSYKVKFNFEANSKFFFIHIVPRACAYA